MLPFTILFVVYKASSALLLDWGYATESSQCFTRHVFRTCRNRLDMKGGPPLLLSSFETPYVWDSSWQIDINLEVVAWPCFCWYKISQLVNLSVETRYVKCLLEKKFITICWKDQSRDGGNSDWLSELT